MSLIFQNYIFSLLTGYMDPPAGVTLAENQHYNPYFPLGAIGMAQALYDEVINIFSMLFYKQTVPIVTYKSRVIQFIHYGVTYYH